MSVVLRRQSAPLGPVHRQHQPAQVVRRRTADEHSHRVMPSVRLAPPARAQPLTDALNPQGLAVAAAAQAARAHCEAQHLLSLSCQTFARSPVTPCEPQKMVPIDCLTDIPLDLFERLVKEAQRASERGQHRLARSPSSRVHLVRGSSSRRWPRDSETIDTSMDKSSNRDVSHEGSYNLDASISELVESCHLKKMHAKASVDKLSCSTRSTDRTASSDRLGHSSTDWLSVCTDASSPPPYLPLRGRESSQATQPPPFSEAQCVNRSTSGSLGLSRSSRPSSLSRREGAPASEVNIAPTQAMRRRSSWVPTSRLGSPPPVTISSGVGTGPAEKRRQRSPQGTMEQRHRRNSTQNLVQRPQSNARRPLSGRCGTVQSARVSERLAWS